MENKNPFLPLLNQLVEIMNVIQNHKDGLVPIPKELADELKRLEKEFALINESAKEFMKNIDKDFNTLRIETMHFPDIPENDKKTFERAVKVGRDAEILKAEVGKLRKKAGPSKTKKMKSSENDDSKIKERRKRFKPLGTDKNWIPL